MRENVMKCFLSPSDHYVTDILNLSFTAPIGSGDACAENNA